MSKWRRFWNQPHQPPWWASVLAMVIVLGVLLPFVFLPIGQVAAELVDGLLDQLGVWSMLGVQT